MHHATIGKGHQSSGWSGAVLECNQQLQDNPNFEGEDAKSSNGTFQHTLRDKREFQNMVTRELCQKRHLAEQREKAARRDRSSGGGQGVLEGGLGGCGQATRASKNSSV